MTSRYTICKQTLLTNLEYAKLKQIPIVIILFDHSVRIFTNIVIGNDTKELIKHNFDTKYELYENLSYDQIIDEINISSPNGGTNFLLPFKILDSINEIDKQSKIFFLSDGQNEKKLTDDNITFLSKYKDRITTMGIGSKSNYDESLMNILSRTNETIEGQSADIIQQELLAQMSNLDINTNITDTWNNVEITIIGKINDLKVGSMMKLTGISEEEYNNTSFKQNTENPNLILSIGSNNNMMISKKDIMTNIEMKTNMLIFIVDQSGSMADKITDDHFYENHNTDKLENVEYTLENVEYTFEYVKYVMNIPQMKSYQRIIFSSESLNFKAQIKWTDFENNNKTMILHDINKYTLITNSIVDKAIDIANNIGYYINIATISNIDDNIGYFRKINQICKKEEKFFDDITENNNLSDFSLLELLFYNKKQGMHLFYSTLNASERNIQHLLEGVSSGGGYKLLAATATMSAVCGQTPSQGGEANINYRNINRDISLCSMCYDNPREYIFSCGHCYSCEECAIKHLNSEPENICAYCRKNVTWIRKIIMTADQKNNDHLYKCINKECYNIATIVSKCDSEYHLTYCQKCINSVKRDYKKSKKTHNCFCGKEMNSIVDKIYFN